MTDDHPVWTPQRPAEDCYGTALVRVISNELTDCIIVPSRLPAVLADPENLVIRTHAIGWFPDTLTPSDLVESVRLAIEQHGLTRFALAVTVPGPAGPELDDEATAEAVRELQSEPLTLYALSHDRPVAAERLLNAGADGLLLYPDPWGPLRAEAVARILEKTAELGGRAGYWPDSDSLNRNSSSS